MSQKTPREILETLLTEHQRGAICRDERMKDEAKDRAEADIEELMGITCPWCHLPATSGYQLKIHIDMRHRPDSYAPSKYKSEKEVNELIRATELRAVREDRKVNTKFWKNKIDKMFDKEIAIYKTVLEEN